MRSYPGKCTFIIVSLPGTAVREQSGFLDSRNFNSETPLRNLAYRHRPQCLCANALPHREFPLVSLRKQPPCYSYLAHPLLCQSVFTQLTNSVYPAVPLVCHPQPALQGKRLLLTISANRNRDIVGSVLVVLINLI